MKILLLGYLADMQSAIYIGEAFKRNGHDVTAIATREMVLKYGNAEGQDKILEEIDKGGYNPDMVLILKGLEILPTTLQAIKERFPKSIFVNWFFDLYVGDNYTWENKSYHDTIKMFDYYFCSAGECAKKLNALGLDNVYYLDEACSPKHHGEAYLNNYQKKKYESEVSFIGSLGYFKIHPDRLRYLTRLVRDGFDLTIWGPLICEMKFIPIELRPRLQQQEVINIEHSKVVQTSLINLGLDSNPDLWMGFSARLFRIMCAGGLYLSTATKGLDEMFEINKKGAKITGEEDLIVFYDENDLVAKIDFLLEHDDIRERIALNGQKKVVEEHTFKHRIQEMLKIIGEKNEKTK